MVFQPDPELIQWKLHLASAPEKVYELLSTDTGRASFWAETAVEQGGVIHFLFPNGATWDAVVLSAVAGVEYTVRYYGGSLTTFRLAGDGRGGTDLTLTDRGVAAADRAEVSAGWVSVLLALKAAADFGVDLRTHDPDRQWDSGYAEN
jgi:uncharacterized protein YndB with AHSA1/START domain